MKQKKPVSRETVADRKTKEKKNDSKSPPLEKTPKRAEIKSETVVISGYRSDGQGIARLADGRVIFIPGVVLDETVRAVFPDSGERFVEGFAEEIVEPSPDRIAERYPPLARFPLGNLQFLPIDRQLAAKTAILRDQLTRVGKFKPDSLKIEPPVASPTEWGYLTEMAFELAEDGSIRVPESGETDPAQRCPIAAAAINEVLDQFKFEPETGLKQVVFRADRDGEIQLILFGETERPEIELETDLAVSVVYVAPSSASFVLSGDSTILQDAGGITVAVSESASCYLNPAVYAPLFSRLDELLPQLRGKRVLILNPGLGLWVKWAALRGADCAAVIEEEAEADDFLVNMADEAMADHDVALYFGFPDQVLPALTPEPEWVIIDLSARPLHVNTIDCLERVRPRQLLVVGEDPAASARDLSRLIGAGYELRFALPFDIAPQTAAFGCVYYLVPE